MLNQSISVVIIILLAFSSMGCKKDTDSICDSLLKGSATASEEQLVGIWKFDHFSKQGSFKSKEKPPENLKEMTVQFTDSSWIFVAMQNNGCTGEFETSEENLLTIPPLLCTLVGGTEEEIRWEVRFDNALINSICYGVKKEKLEIHFSNNDDDKNLMQFSKK